MAIEDKRQGHATKIDGYLQNISFEKRISDGSDPKPYYKNQLLLKKRTSSRVTSHLEKVADEMVLDEDVSGEYLLKLLPTTAASKLQGMFNKGAAGSVTIKNKGLM